MLTTGTLSSVASVILDQNIQVLKTFNGHTYALTSAATTWAQGKVIATALGGYLTTINTKAENDWLTAIFRIPYGESWIGANDIATSNTWVWDNGTTSGDNGLTDDLCGSSGCQGWSNATWPDYTNKWQGANPNHSGASCGYIWRTSGAWDDVSCGSSKYAIIEFDQISTQLALHNLDDDTDVTVAVSSSNTSEGTVSPATLTFTEANWNTAQTVTVTGVDDNNSDGHQQYQVKLSSIAENGLVAYYPFNGNANDESVNSNLGTVNGATLTTDRTANANQAYQFDGSSDYLSLPSTNAVSGLANFTFQSWVYWNGSGSGSIYAEGSSTSNNPMFSIIPRSVDNGGIELVYRDQSAIGLVAQPTTGIIPPNEWTHIAVIKTSSTNIKVYINGILTDDLNFAEPASWSVTDVRIGNRKRISAGDHFNGKIDEVRLYNRALTESEVKHLFLNSNVDVTLHNLDDDFPATPQIVVSGVAVQLRNFVSTKQ